MDGGLGRGRGYETDKALRGQHFFFFSKSLPNLLSLCLYVLDNCHSANNRKAWKRKNRRVCVTRCWRKLRARDVPVDEDQARKAKAHQWWKFWKKEKISEGNHTLKKKEKREVFIKWKKVTKRPAGIRTGDLSLTGRMLFRLCYKSRSRGERSSDLSFKSFVDLPFIW